MADRARGLELLDVAQVGAVVEDVRELLGRVDVVDHAEVDVVGAEAVEQILERALHRLDLAGADVLAALPRGAEMPLDDPVLAVAGDGVADHGADARVAHPAVEDVHALLAGRRHDGRDLLGALVLEPLPADADLGNPELRPAQPAVLHLLPHQRRGGPAKGRPGQPSAPNPSTSRRANR